MKWFYALAGQQQGPVDDAQLDALLAAGTITLETLVWREGLANWQPLRQARAAVTGAASPIPPASPGPVPPVTVSLGAGLPPGDSSAPFDPATFLAGVRERDYQIDVGGLVGRAWELVKANLGICIGVVALVYVCLIAASVIPCVGTVLQLAVQGPLMGGLYWFFLKLIRREGATVNDAFAGFSRGYLQLFLAALVPSLLAGLCMLPGFAMIFAGAAMKMNISPIIIGIAFFIGLIPAVYISVCWVFTIPLVMDKQIGFWEAMELSRKVVTLRWGNYFVLLLVCGLITFVGLLALCVGILVAAPVAIAALAYAYDEIFGHGSKPS